MFDQQVVGVAETMAVPRLDGTTECEVVGIPADFGGFQRDERFPERSGGSEVGLGWGAAQVQFG